MVEKSTTTATKTTTTTATTTTKGSLGSSFTNFNFDPIDDNNVEKNKTFTIIDWNLKDNDDSTSKNPKRRRSDNKKRRSGSATTSTESSSDMNASIVLDYIGGDDDDDDDEDDDNNHNENETARDRQDEEEDGSNNSAHSFADDVEDEDENDCGEIIEVDDQLLIKLAQTALDQVQSSMHSNNNNNATAAKITTTRKAAEPVPHFNSDEIVAASSKPIRKLHYLEEFLLKDIHVSHNHHHHHHDDDDDGSDDDDNDDDAHDNTQQEQARSRFAGRVHQDHVQHKKHHYVLKFVQEDVVNSQNQTRITHAFREILTESTVLQSASMIHPNIIQMYGFHVDPVVTSLDTYFYITDCIQETLPERLSTWKENSSSSPTSNNNKKPDLHERLDLALEIASAIAYLHDRNMVYWLRPLKVGFDARYARLKLCDLTQICTVGTVLDSSNCSYYYHKHRWKGKREAKDNRTMDLAMIQFTAPEILSQTKHATKHITIQTSIDVYAFGVVLWELATLKEPYSNIAKETSTLWNQIVSKQLHAIVNNHKRPSINQYNDVWKLCTGLKELIQQCWDPFKRPTMHVVIEKLGQMLLFQDEDDNNAGSNKNAAAEGTKHNRKKKERTNSKDKLLENDLAKPSKNTEEENGTEEEPRRRKSDDSAPSRRRSDSHLASFKKPTRAHSDDLAYLVAEVGDEDESEDDDDEPKRRHSADQGIIRPTHRGRRKVKAAVNKPIKLVDDKPDKEKSSEKADGHNSSKIDGRSKRRSRSLSRGPGRGKQRGRSTELIFGKEESEENGKHASGGTKDEGTKRSLSPKRGQDNKTERRSRSISPKARSGRSVSPKPKEETKDPKKRSGRSVSPKGRSKSPPPDKKDDNHKDSKSPRKPIRRGSNDGGKDDIPEKSGSGEEATKSPRKGRKPNSDGTDEVLEALSSGDEVVSSPRHARRGRRGSHDGASTGVQGNDQTEKSSPKSTRRVIRRGSHDGASGTDSQDIATPVDDGAPQSPRKKANRSGSMVAGIGSPRRRVARNASLGAVRPTRELIMESPVKTSRPPVSPKSSPCTHLRRASDGLANPSTRGRRGSAKTGSEFDEQEWDQFKNSFDADFTGSPVESKSPSKRTNPRSIHRRKSAGTSHSSSRVKPSSSKSPSDDPFANEDLFAAAPFPDTFSDLDNLDNASPTRKPGRKGGSAHAEIPDKSSRQRFVSKEVKPQSTNLYEHYSPTKQKKPANTDALRQLRSNVTMAVPGSKKTEPQSMSPKKRGLFGILGKSNDEGGEKVGKDPKNEGAAARDRDRRKNGLMGALFSE